MAKSPDRNRLKSKDESAETRVRNSAQDELINLALGYGGGGEPVNDIPGDGWWKDPVTGAVFEGDPPPDYQVRYDPWSKTYVKAEPQEAMPDYIEEQPMDALVFDQLGPSAMDGVSPNQWAVQSQWDALAGVKDIYDQGGLTAIDRARIADARAQEDAYLRGQRESTVADMNARGMGGSGMELLAQMQAQQGAGQRMSMAGVQTEALAQARRDAALQSMSGMATGLREQGWNEDTAKAQARDQINHANWEAGRQGKAATWSAEEARRTRVAAGKNDRAMQQYDDPYARQRERAAVLGLAADKNVGYYSADTGRQSANTAAAAQAEEAKQNTIGNIFQPIKFALGGG